MVYPQMNHIERPEGIIISSAIQVSETRLGLVQD